jgi:ABC-type Fe3+ transport system permease subunit
LTGCWLARDSRWFRWLLVGVSIWAWVTPASVIGIGLKELIQALVRVWPDGPQAAALYYAPSPLPVMWAQALRVLPIAVAFLWPVVRMIPRELFEETRLGGAGPWSEFSHVVWPTTRRAWLVTALALTALCLGEVAASARVETAGWKMFATVLYDRMHYGADSTVAALCVLLLGTIAGVGGVVLTAGAIFRRLASQA